jgi:hypothetical protein
LKRFACAVTILSLVRGCGDVLNEAVQRKSRS